MSALPHLASDFFAWIWYHTEATGGEMTVEGQTIRIWVDDRLAFHAPSEDRSRAVLTGDDAPRGAEARAALIGGKVIREIRLRIDKDTAEFGLTLRAPNLDIAGLVLPPMEGEGGDEAATLHIRMGALEELWFIIAGLYRQFSAVRTSAAWRDEVVPDLVRWLTDTP